VRRKHWETRGQNGTVSRDGNFKIEKKISRTGMALRLVGRREDSEGKGVWGREKKKVPYEPSLSPDPRRGHVGGRE